MKIIIIDYGAGNVESVSNAIKEIDSQSDIIISNKVADLKSANYFILPISMTPLNRPITGKRRNSLDLSSLKIDL